MTERYVIETHDLTKRYRGFEAVSNLNLRVGAGRITGFLGRNGAEKSSTIKMLMGISRASSGGGTLLGRSMHLMKTSPEKHGSRGWLGARCMLPT